MLADYFAPQHLMLAPEAHAFHRQQKPRLVGPQKMFSLINEGKKKNGWVGWGGGATTVAGLTVHPAFRFLVP